MQDKDQAVRFISSKPPFDLLSQSEIETVAGSLTKSHHYRDMTLFVQNKTVLNHVFIVFQGRLEQYIQENEDKLLRSFLEEGDIYGGISILFNRGVSIRTVRSIEDVTFFRLPKDVFIDVCSQNPQFTNHFTQSFGEKIQEKPYVEFIAKSARQEDDDLPSGFLNKTLTDVFSRDMVACEAETSIQDVARLMNEKKRSSLLIRDPGGEYIGLLTDHDLRQKVIAEGLSVQLPVRQVMSSPLITASSDSEIYEAILIMMQNNIKHLAVVDESAKLLGIATEQDLLLAQGRSPVFLMHEIQQANSVEEMALRQAQTPDLIKSLMDGGAKARHINRIITAISDAILKKVARLAIDRLGEPPARFAFMIMGSEGRKEQTLKTDQDNAIVYENVSSSREDEVQEYFLELGRTISGWLDQIGYTYCEFEIMGQNPKWCQSLDQWKKYFSTWIRTAEPEALLQSSIFFDFRLGYGDQSIIDELRRHLFQSLSGWIGFFRHMAENALHFKPPLDFFGNFVLQSKEKKNTLDIKSPMRLIVDFARIYALKNAIQETNTLERLEEMAVRNILERQDADELIHAYSYLMHMRLAHQVDNIIEKRIAPDNYIYPKQLTHIEQQALKEAFKRIRMAQGKMRMELTYDTGIT